MFSRNFKKLFTDNWNLKMEPGNDRFQASIRVSGYPGTRHIISDLLLPVYEDALQFMTSGLVGYLPNLCF